MADDMQKINENNNKSQIPRWTGGPKGLGDPDDKLLRKVEKEILVAQMVRDRTRDQKCVPEVAAFNECCQRTKYLMVVKCRKQNSELKSCLERWYKDDQLWTECTEDYLKERTEFRKTGEPRKIREFKTRVQSNM